MKFESSRLVLGLFVETIILCLITTFRFTNIESTATLLVFNLLFFSLTFQLNGALNIKMGMLALGNITGLLWNVVLYYFAASGVAFFGEPFNVFYAVSYPFLNFIWIVAFWSLSLTVFPKLKSTVAEVNS
jgi:hypothetical protein